MMNSIRHSWMSAFIVLTGCPKILRADMGTENSLLATVQQILRHFDSDSLAGGISSVW